ncbi:tripartite tricarboxylate transporter substrate binding protein [Cupriavidus basilensis]|uniref:Tripartite tricarboxylate transporter substrate binding protein n=1 Tax=Cupriavidus basilensis TaxID=68895 RepID=A0ABT6B242_9BURK|nr:tripartite tricarboxylate transporter substrate binding protein [Cupriavidus basilensis]MDF3838954.1 tripartite tricarboxylate transporter substrate binding protein [Cupriavidus basilensis]
MIRATRTGLALGLLILAGITLPVAAATVPAPASSFPGKSITIVVPTAAGGANDAMARVLAQHMSVGLRTPVIVENRAGANGAIASEYVARAKPDGHTLLFGYIATHGIGPALQRLRYDPVKDFVPVGMVASSPTLLVVNTAVKAADVMQLVSLARNKEAQLSYASAGNGTAPHVTAELFRLVTGAELLHVPYKGSAPALLDVIAGNTQVMFPSLFTAYPQIVNGRIRALAVAGETRTPLLANVPTLKEAGVDGVSVDQWYAMFAPAATPAHVVRTLNRALNDALADPAVSLKIAEQGAYVRAGTPAQLGELVRAELRKWQGVVQAAGIRPD